MEFTGKKVQLYVDGLTNGVTRALGMVLLCLISTNPLVREGPAEKMNYRLMLVEINCIP